MAKNNNGWSVKRKVVRPELLKNALYGSWFSRLYCMGLSCFSWDGFPDSVNRRYLETILFWNGAAVLFKDETLGYLTLPVTWDGTPDVYGEPLQYTGYSINYRSKPLNRENSVIIYDNLARIPICPTVENYSRRLAEIDRSIDINALQQRTPYLITCDETQRLTMENVFKRILDGETAVFGKKGLGLQSNIETIPANSPYVCDKLQTLKKQLLTECCTVLGIESNVSEKTERSVTSEIGASMGMTETLRLNRLRSREQAVDRINAVFPDLEITVNFDSKLNLAMLYEGGGENGSLYDATQNDTGKPERDSSQ